MELSPLVTQQDKKVINTDLPLEHVSLGQGVDYQFARALMKEKGDLAAQTHQNTLIFCQHQPTITVTRSKGKGNLLVSEEALEKDGFTLVIADRGGDITFHGPGQLVCYPVLKLNKLGLGYPLVDYVRRLERMLIQVCTELGIKDAKAQEGRSGVWIGADKIIAIGVGVDRNGITRHGFSFNCDIDLEPYLKRIVPCGLAGHGVTSLQKTLSCSMPEYSLIEECILKQFNNFFYRT